MNKQMKSGAPAKEAPELKMLQSALYYATKHGFSIIPCVERDKRPLTEHGVKDASRDPQILSSWWKMWPTANVGIACGAASGGLLVLDVDGEEGLESLRAFEINNGALPVTGMVITGKGQQYYFRSPRGFKNRVRVAPGIDIRTDSGYVIAPPSIHPNGRSYIWEVSRRIDEVPIADTPKWLSDLLSSSEKDQFQRRDWTQIAATGAPIGARNQTLASVAGHLFCRHVDPKLAYALLRAWNQCCTESPLPKDEFDRTVNSIAMAEVARKRGVKHHG